MKTLKIEFTKPLRGHLNQKNYIEGDIEDINVDVNLIPLENFWRGVFRDNEISPLFKILKSKAKKSDGKSKS